MYTFSMRHTNSLHDVSNTVVISNPADIYRIGSMMKQRVWGADGILKSNTKPGDIFEDYVYFDLSNDLAYNIFSHHGEYKTNMSVADALDMLHIRFVNLLAVTIPALDDIRMAYTKLSEDRSRYISADAFFWDIIMTWVGRYWDIIYSIGLNRFKHDISRYDFVEFLADFYHPKR